MAFSTRNKKLVLSITEQLQAIHDKLQSVWEQETERYDDMSENAQASDDGEAHQQALGTVEAAFGTIEEVAEGLSELRDL